MGVAGRMSSMSILVPSKPLTGLVARPELVLLGLVIAVCIACVGNAVLKNQAVDWMGFIPAIGASFALVLMGVYVRAMRQMQRMALGAIGFGIFAAFSSSIAIFIYTLFPLAHPLIDPSLIAYDAAVGFSWIRFVEFIAGYPVLGIALHYVYLSILPQVVCVIILLSFLNRAVALHRFLASGIVCMIVTVGFWWLFPSVGPAAFGMVSPDIQARISLLANDAYGAEMRRLAADGIDVITPLRITGVIAFPSFHMVMACMVVWFTRRTWAFLPLVLVNGLMIPATIVHGGHHLIDLAGGLVTFTACLWGVTRLIPTQQTA
jgi:hypothetical protein